VQEVLLALWLEHEHSKDQILEMYLNRVYFGSGAYGVEAASRRYFGKSARNVTLSEAALLAGLLKAPSRCRPPATRRPQTGARPGGARRHERRRHDRLEGARLRHERARHARGRLLDRSRRTMWPTGSWKNCRASSAKCRTDIVVDTTIDTHAAEARRGVHPQADRGERRKAEGQPGGAGRRSTGRAPCAPGRRRATTPGEPVRPRLRRRAASRARPSSRSSISRRWKHGRTPDSVRNDAPIKIGKWTPENYKGKYLRRA
jgi:penicillin-binding protein 1A